MYATKDSMWWKSWKFFRALSLACRTLLQRRQGRQHQSVAMTPTSAVEKSFFLFPKVASIQCFCSLICSSPLVPRSIWFSILLCLGIVHDEDSDSLKIAWFVLVFISLLAIRCTYDSVYELYLDLAYHFLL